MRKKIVIGISIFSVFIICSLSYQSDITIAMDIDICENSNEVEWQTLLFLFGSIHNLSYSDEFGGWYSFNCISVLAIYLIKGYGFHIQIFNSDDEMIISINFIMDDVEFLYKGYIGERVICGIQIVKYID